ncbi:MAG: TolC family protein [Armatimonadota bacterium]
MTVSNSTPKCATVIIAVLFLFAFFMCGACLGAEETQKLSLVDAVSAALRSNANLQSAQSARSNSLSRLRIANLMTGFDFGTRTAIERSPDDRTRSSQLFSNITYKNLIGTEASVNLAPLGMGGDRGAITMELRHPLRKNRGLFSAKSDQVLGARSDATIREKELYLTTQATVLGVVEAYYSAVLAREQVKVQEQAVSIAKEAADGARKRAAEGLVAEIEVSRAEIRVAQTDNELNRQKQNAHAALDALMVAMGSGVGEKPELIEAVPEPKSIGDPPGLATAMETALKNRSELAVYDTNLSEQARKLAMAKDELKPGLDLVANFNSTTPDAGLISRSMWDAGYFTGGLEYKLPLDRRALTEERSIAENNLEITRKLRKYEMEQIAKQVRDAYRGLETARTSLDIFGQNLAVAEDNLRMAQIRVDEGLSDNREVLDAQEALTLVQNQLLSAKVDLYLAGINLKSAMGEDLTIMGAQ